MAAAIEQAVANTGLYVRISATTNGTHSATSRHYSGMAVDIGRVSGTADTRDDSPSDPGNLYGLILQEELRRSLPTRENFGPFVNEKRPTAGAVPEPTSDPKIVNGHKDHIHVSVQTP